MSLDIGTSAYAFSAGIADAVKKSAGITSRVVSAGTDIARLLPLRSGEAQLAILAGAPSWNILRGMWDFAVEEWGPQPIQIIWRGADLYTGFFTRGNAPYKNMNEELKGSKTAYIPGMPSANSYAQGVLAFANIKTDDVKYVTLSSLGTAYTAVVSGAIDWVVAATTGATQSELAASPAGIHWLPMPPENKAAWDRMYQKCPWIAPGLADRGGGISPQKPAAVMAVPYYYWAYEKADIDTVYAYVKGMWEGYDLYKGAHAELPYWNHETALNTNACFAPFHAGAVKFFKEKGVWTAEHEKWQQAQLEAQAKRLKLWETAVEEARTQKITLGSDAFKDFWWKKVADAGLLR